MAHVGRSRVRDEAELARGRACQWASTESRDGQHRVGLQAKGRGNANRYFVWFPDRPGDYEDLANEDIQLYEYSEPRAPGADADADPRRKEVRTTVE